jgi:Icc protein
MNPDLVLVTGDLCQDESWGGYVRLRRALSQHVCCPVALLPGNHDHPLFLDAVLGRTWATAPADLLLQGVRVLLLSSHRVGSAAGELGPLQLRWLAQRLQCSERRDLPLVVALHHPPIAIGDAGMDAIRLLDQACLEELLRPHRALQAVLFGHIHQHWQGSWATRPDVLLLGCPSTLSSFKAVQPCPLGRADDPGGRLLEVTPEGNVQHQVLRWSSV